MNWDVELAENAEDDIENIYNYIAVTLDEPVIAWNQTERIRDKIKKLCYLPKRYPVVQDEPWKSRKVRKMTIDNYTVFYFLNDAASTVTVIRVFYSRRNIKDNIHYLEEYTTCDTSD